MSSFRLPGRRDAAPPRTALGRLLEDERFVGGLGLGALIGAAIAGSTLWNRARGDRHRAEAADALIVSHQSPRSDDH